MLRRYRNLVVITCVVVLAIAIWIIFFFQGQSFIEPLLGSLFGTFAGAGVVFLYQVRIDRTKHFNELFSRGQRIMADKTAWRLLYGEWINVEFRSAVGMATWINDPEKHNEFHTYNMEKYQSIAWHGVAYNIDDNFCVASKALHEYTSWFLNLMEAYHTNLLTSHHIKMMWNLIIDTMYPLGAYIGENKIGMRKWVEYFVLGNAVYKRSDIEKNSRREYKQYMAIRKVIENYKPACMYASDRMFKSAEPSKKNYQR